VLLSQSSTDNNNNNNKRPPSSTITAAWTSFRPSPRSAARLSQHQRECDVRWLRLDLWRSCSNRRGLVYKRNNDFLGSATQSETKLAERNQRKHCQTLVQTTLVAVECGFCLPYAGLVPEQHPQRNGAHITDQYKAADCRIRVAVRGRLPARKTTTSLATSPRRKENGRILPEKRPYPFPRLSIFPELVLDLNKYCSYSSLASWCFWTILCFVKPFFKGVPNFGISLFGSSWRGGMVSYLRDIY
jgi:hypothetical protein